MLQQVLSIGRTVFHLTDDANQLGMQAVDTKVDGGTLTRLDNLVLQLLLHLGNDLLDTCGMDTSVGYQLMECQTASLAANGVEGRDNDGLRRVVDDDFNTTSSLQGTDVTPLASDDTTLHIVVVDMEDADRVLDSRLRGYSLDGLDDNLLGLGIGIQLRLVHNLVDVSLSVGLGLVLQRLYQAGLGLIGRKSRQLFELGTLLHLHLLQLLLLQLQQLLFVVDAGLLVVELVLATSQFLLALVERNLALLQLVLVLLDMLVALLHLLLQLALLVQELLLHLEQFLFLDDFCLFLGGIDHLVIFSLDDEAENQKATHATQYKGCDDGNNSNNDVHKCLYILS